MTQSSATLARVRVDPANPGQFFACCGVLELADRLWGGAVGWFEDDSFCLRPLTEPALPTSLAELVGAIAHVPLRQIELDDDFSSPVEIPDPFGLRLDWWKDHRSGGDRLKVWAGSMRSVRIARAMQSELTRAGFQDESLLDRATVVYDPLEPDKKVEPFYFDARRGSNSQPIDIGFSPDSLQMTSAAYPAVEFLCLVGLQRFRPAPTSKRRVFHYYTWRSPLAPSVASLAACGVLDQIGAGGFRFENAFRTDQRKHKAFTAATPIERNDNGSSTQ
jgi:hypothetical protein